MSFDDMSLQEEEYNEKIKIMIIGDSNVGKTSIIKRFCKNEFSPSFISSIGIDYESKYINIDKKVINLQLWDTAGQERYRVLARNYYKQSDAFMIVYDITSRGTFNSINNWIEQIKENASNSVKYSLLGNKCDLEEMRQVQKDEGYELAKRNDVEFYETSAQKGKNIEKAFINLAKKILSDNNFRSESECSSSISKKLNKNNNNDNAPKKCC